MRAEFERRNHCKEPTPLRLPPRQNSLLRNALACVRKFLGDMSCHGGLRKGGLPPLARAPGQLRQLCRVSQKILSGFPATMTNSESR